MTEKLKARGNHLMNLIHEVEVLNAEVLKLKSEKRNEGFVNKALHLACTELNNENLELKINNETLKCEVELLKGDRNAKAGGEGEKT